MAESLWIGVSTLWVSTFLYGIYLVLFVHCLRILLFRSSTSHSGNSKTMSILLVSALIMFLLSTTSVLVSLLQGATAYGSLRLSLPQLQIARAIAYVTNNVVADALLIYRCYVIWNTLWITIVPLLLLVATMLLGYAIQLRLFFILSLTTNLLVPVLVAGRLWWALRRFKGSAHAATRRQGRKAVAILLESGLLYSTAVSIHMVFFHYHNPMDEVVYGVLGQLVGIVPTLIIVRVGKGVSHDCSDDARTAVDPSSASIKRTPSNASARTVIDPTDDDSDARTVVVHVTRDVEIHGGFLEKSAWDAESIV